MSEKNRPIIVSEAAYHAIRDHLPAELLERCHIDPATIDAKEFERRLDRILEFERTHPELYNNDVPF